MTTGDALRRGTEIEIAERFLAAREADDVEACLALVADRAVWHSPVGPAKHGRDGFREALADAYAETRWFTTETLEVRTHGQAVVAQVRNRGERDGEELDSLQLLVIRVEDGAIVDVEIHVDDPQAIAEFWSD
jgi:ketosteroid isomerase-like protein